MYEPLSCCLMADRKTYEQILRIKEFHRKIVDGEVEIPTHRLVKVVISHWGDFDWVCECGGHGHGRSSTERKAKYLHAKHAVSSGVPAVPTRTDLDL